MFTFSGLILEARENLFRDFWSPFSISSYFSSERKKTQPTSGCNRPKLSRPGGFISRASGPSQPTSRRGPNPNPNPSRQPPPPPRRRSGGAARRLRFAAPRNLCRLKKIPFVVFLFRRIFPRLFSHAISDPIFVLV